MKFSDFEILRFIFWFLWRILQHSLQKQSPYNCSVVFRTGFSLSLSLLIWAIVPRKLSLKVCPLVCSSFGTIAQLFFVVVSLLIWFEQAHIVPRKLSFDLSYRSKKTQSEGTFCPWVCSSFGTTALLFFLNWFLSLLIWFDHAHIVPRKLGLKLRSVIYFVQVLLISWLPKHLYFLENSVQLNWNSPFLKWFSFSCLILVISWLPKHLNSLFVSWWFLWILQHSPPKTESSQLLCCFLSRLSFQENLTER